MKKLLLLLAVSITLLLTACTEPEGKIENAKIVEKMNWESCSNDCYYDYSILVEKDGETIELGIKSRAMYKALKEGSTVTVTYSHMYYVIDLSLSNMDTVK